jgi:hypothetical protein
MSLVVEITTNESDSVTLRVGTVKAHIEGADWQEANEAAHLLGGLLSQRVKARDLAGRLRAIEGSLNGLDEMLRGAEHHMLDLVAHAASLLPTEGQVPK